MELNLKETLIDHFLVTYDALDCFQKTQELLVNNF
jgi:hypothetical protein